MIVCWVYTVSLGLNSGPNTDSTVPSQSSIVLYRIASTTALSLSNSLKQRFNLRQNIQSEICWFWGRGNQKCKLIPAALHVSVFDVFPTCTFKVLFHKCEKCWMLFPFFFKIVLIIRMYLVSFNKRCIAKNKWRRCKVVFLLSTLFIFRLRSD